jgi:hypothetical protein
MMASWVRLRMPAISQVRSDRLPVANSTDKFSYSLPITLLTRTSHKTDAESSMTAPPTQVIKSHFDTILPSLQIPGVVVVMSLKDFCDRLSASSIRRSSHVIRIIRRKEKKGLRHEFLLVNVALQSEQTFWLRLERAADRRRREFWPRIFTSRFLPDDKAKLAGRFEDLFDAGTSTTIAELQLSSVTFSNSLQAFQLLLSSFSEVSTHYTLPQQNCWFFCTAVMDTFPISSPYQLTQTSKSLVFAAKLLGQIKSNFTFKLREDSFDRIDETLGKHLSRINAQLTSAGGERAQVERIIRDNIARSFRLI